jgi:hypothetical protein
MTLSKAETFFDWMANILGLAGGIPAIAEKIGNLWGNIPDDLQKKIQQEMPGFLGLSLADERIFNALLTKLTLDERKLLASFLHDKCKDFQRNRFINIVAGMKFVEGSPEITEQKFDKNGKAIGTRIISAIAEKDFRFDFIRSFAEYLKSTSTDEAFAFCISGRMVLQDPIYQTALTKWKDSIKWFEETILKPFSASTIRELRINISRVIYDAGTAIEDKTASMPKHTGHLRGIFGNHIGGFFEKIFC